MTVINLIQLVDYPHPGTPTTPAIGGDGQPRIGQAENVITTVTAYAVEHTHMRWEGAPLDHIAEREAELTLTLTNERLIWHTSDWLDPKEAFAFHELGQTSWAGQVVGVLATRASQKRKRKKANRAMAAESKVVAGKLDLDTVAVIAVEPLERPIADVEGTIYFIAKEGTQAHHIVTFWTPGDLGHLQELAATVCTHIMAAQNEDWDVIGNPTINDGTFAYMLSQPERLSPS